MLSNLQALSHITLDKMRCFLVRGGGDGLRNAATRATCPSCFLVHKVIYIVKSLKSQAEE